MLRRARALVLQLQQQQTSTAANSLAQVVVACSLHAGSTPSLVSKGGGVAAEQPGSATAQPEQQHQQPQQHTTPGSSQEYHAAALQFDQPQWQQQQPPRAQSEHHQPHNQHWAASQQQQQWQEMQSRLPAAVAAAAAMPNTTTTSSSSSSGAGQAGDAGNGGGGSGSNADFLSLFTLSNPEEQYRRTVASLRMAKSRNMEQVHMFDPQAVLAAPDRGAAVLEGLMWAAARLQDLQLLRQLLRCTAAAGNPLSGTGHRAVLHCLAKCGRAGEALEWLQVRVPEDQLTPHLLRQLVQPLIQQQQVQAAQRALDYAEPKLQQRWQAQLLLQQQQQAEGDAAGGSSSHLDQQPPQQQMWSERPGLLRWHEMQELPCMRLAVAGATGTLAAVQQQWTAILKQAQEAEQQQQSLLSVSVLAGYVLALQKAARRIDSQGKAQANQLLVAALLQLFDRYHATAWDSYLQQQAARFSSQLTGDAGHGRGGGSISSAGQVDAQQQMQWLRQRQQLAQQLWRQHVQHAAVRTWQDVDAAAVMPQEVAYSLHRHERELCRQALHAGLTLAYGTHSAQQMEQLLKLGSLLKVMPRQDSFETLLHFKGNRQGAPPEALEELLGEMMAWGITPTVAAYEHVMEAHASHRDLEAAEAVLDRMDAAGLRPVLSTYNRLLHGVAINGDLAAAIRVYNRMRLQGLQPDIQTMRGLFKCVRLYASNVRVATARTIAQTNPGDREIIFSLLSQRSALFASAYSQLAQWQRDMGAVGLKHNAPSMTHLTAALERLGAVEDCLQLARLAEGARPGEFVAHRAALKAAGRSRDVRTVGEATKITARLAESEEGLSKADYLALISSQFWLKQDHEQLLRTVAEMKAAGHELDENVVQQLLHVYCHNGMWGEALQVLNDAAAGRFGQPGARSSSGGSYNAGQQHQQHQQQQQAVSAAHGRASAASNDKLWHVVMRKLWERRAPDELLNEFLRHMSPAQMQRFKLLYGLQAVPGQRGRYTLMPLEDWQLPLQLPSQLQKDKQQQQQRQQVDGSIEGGQQGDSAVQLGLDEAEVDEQQQQQVEQGQPHHHQQHQLHQQDASLLAAGVAW